MRCGRFAAWLALCLAVPAGCGINEFGAASDTTDAAGGIGGIGVAGSDSGFGGTGGASGGTAGAPDASPDAPPDVVSDVTDGEPDAAPAPPYKYRRAINVSAGPSGIPAGATLELTFDHAAVVAAGQAKASGADVRVYRAGSPDKELHRVVDPLSSWGIANTLIQFRAEAAVSGTDSGYYLYFGDTGDSGASGALEDPKQVYAVWDGFDGTSLGAEWSVQSVGVGSGTAAVGSGTLTMVAGAGDIWGVSDNFLYVHRAVLGDAIVDAKVVGAGGVLNSWARVGGLMVRADTSPDAPHRLVGGFAAPVGLGTITRPQKAALSTGVFAGASLVLPYIARLERAQDATRTWIAAGAAAMSEIGVPQQVALGSTPRVGIHFANNSGTQGFVSVDWFRARARIPEPPAVSLGPVQTVPFGS